MKMINICCKQGYNRGTHAMEGRIIEKIDDELQHQQEEHLPRYGPRE